MMTFSIVIPTIGRPTLEQTLGSIVPQLHAGDEVIVVRDSYEDLDDRCDVRNRVEAWGPQVQYAEFNAGYHFYGLPQSNVGFSRAAGDAVMAMSDDDVYVPGAFDRLREVTAPDPLRPVLCQFLAPWREILWDERRMVRSRIGGSCMVAPRIFNAPFPDGRYVEVDFDWMVAILARAAEAGRAPLWLEEVLVITRPDLRKGKLPTGVTRCRCCHGPRYLEDVNAERLCVLCAQQAVAV